MPSRWPRPGLAPTEPAGLGSFRLTGSSPFCARQASSDREDSSSCTMAWATRCRVGARSARRPAPASAASSQAVLQSGEEPSVWLLSLQAWVPELTVDREALPEVMLADVPVLPRRMGTSTVKRSEEMLG